MKNTIYSLIIVTFLAGAMPVSAASVPSGTLIKGTGAAVYYVTSEGKRLAFPNAATYFTWYSDFSSVKKVSDAELASYSLVGNVTYRPGSRMLKLVSAPTVYAVAHGGILRAISSEAIARSVYGSNWNKQIDDLADGFFVNYKIGAPVASTGEFVSSVELASSPNINADRNLSVAVSSKLSAASVGPVSLSGRIMSVAIDPNNENVAFVGSASGGIWKTTDRGVNWIAVADRLASMHVGALAIDPQNTSTIYAGTGETYMPGDDYGYMGIYVSRDAGTSWNLLDSTTKLPISAVAEIAVDPKDAAHIYMAANSGLYESKNSGLNWNKILDGFIENIMISSTDNNIIFATGSGTLIARSMNGGATWTKLAGWNINRGFPADNPWFNRVTISQSSGKTLVQTTKHVIYVALEEPFMLFRSDDEGDSWHEVAKQPYSGMRNYAVVADPLDADIVFTAGSALHRATEGGWTVVVEPLHNYDIRALEFAPSNVKVIYAATDSGVEVSNDGGVNWIVRSNGLNTTQWYSASVSRDGAVIYGSVQDHSMLRRYGNSSWQDIFWGDSRETVADPLKNNVVYTLSSDSKRIGRSVDNGQLFTPVNGNLASNLNLRALTVDPLTSGTLYIAAGANMYGTDDGGANWYLFGNNNSSSNVTDITVSTTHRIFVGRADGSVDMLLAFGSGTNGPKWTNIYREPNKKAVTEISSVNDNAVVAFNADWGTRVISLDQVAGNWVASDATGDLPEGAWVRSFALDPLNSNIAYIGHLSGAFRGVSNGKIWTWTRLENGLPSVEVTDIATNAATGKVYLATWGRGLYEVTK